VRTTRSKWIWGVPVTLLGLAVLSWLAIVEFASYRLRNTDFSIHSAQIEAMQKNLKAITQLARQGVLPSRKVNHSSVGSALTESKLIELRRDMGIYESMHQRLPIDFIELLNVRFPPDWKDHLEKFEKECEIVSLTPDSCILNCDGWALPSANDVEALVHSFDNQTERFYKVENHVLLFVPPLTKENPAQAKQAWIELMTKPSPPAPGRVPDVP